MRTDPLMWDRDRDGPGVLRYGALAEAIEAMSTEDYCLLMIALSRRAQSDQTIKPDINETGA